jgi:hypothetical protein
MATIHRAPEHDLWSDPEPLARDCQRAVQRRPIRLPGRLTWKDHRGATRFATVVTRDVSEFGVFVECQSAVTIPLYRLVQFQLEADALDADALPMSLRQGRQLSAVYRVTPPLKGSPLGFALRLMVDPARSPALRATA